MTDEPKTESGANGRAADARTDTQGNIQLSRRSFITGTAIAATGLMIVPRHVLGGVGHTAPSDKLNIAGIGVGGMGASNIRNLASQNIVALCDVDWGYTDKSFHKMFDSLGKAQARLDKAKTPAERKKVQEDIEHIRLLSRQYGSIKRHTDFRRMLDEQKDIDAVVIATPDHLHATIASAAMSHGKHVYLQKPLTWSIHEARFLSKKAIDNPRIVTQMGNQGHSSDDARLVNDYIAANAIGEVREVHAWTNRPLAYWPQGIPRPVAVPPPGPADWDMNAVTARLANAMVGNYPLPKGLEWDLFLGPGPEVGYHPVYHPFNWRGWVDWGVGAIGDMGAHLLDSPFWSLDLGLPTAIETVSTPFDKASYPMATMTHFDFPARGDKPPVKLTWYDGGLVPPGLEALGAGQMPDGGTLYVGSKGKLVHETYGDNPRLLPKSLHDSVGTPPQTVARIKTSHEMNWVDACKGKGEATSPFPYAAKLTEIMLLGVVALRAGGRIEYDAANMRITNLADANQYLTREYRKGWTL
ncbi:Gfo/Idh/MocA family oxidoreductase [Luteibacter sp. 329MFSha]|uniref:Gfo/Idh/MocA family protein n=1 Tax=Luteibacter sp. 329MFSha TaxID=1798239 RepID=UPI0008AD3769|nr:Gfo/Idh/MocA family oxidoreductase [Luteibacter sp. 329MFSha]SEW27961.1 Oxidoreductase family, NAD-binding Rossmann fold [Luteibacter sp. 329MFSha]